MKSLYCIISLPLFMSLIACSGTESRSTTPGAGSVEDLTENPSAIITHEGGWTIVSKVENGDHVYWFLAPEVDDVSPALFKKTVYTGKGSELESRVVSQCDAPKQTCENLMMQFKRLSEKYK